MNKFSKNLKFYRTQCKMTQSDVAHSVTVTQQCISDWENNKIEPTMSYLCKLADLFEVTLDELVGRDV